MTNFSKNFALGRPITDADPLRGGRSSFETHGEQTGSKEKDFYPTGGPRGFSTARRAVSSASSVRLPGPGTLENVYRGREFLGTGWVLGDLSGVSIVLRLGPALFNGIVSDPWIDKISFQVFVAPILVKRDILAGE